MAAYKIVPDTLLLLWGGGCRTNGEFGKDLSGVGIDDGRSIVFGYAKTQLRFSYTCGTENNDECFHAVGILCVYRKSVQYALSDDTAFGGGNKINDILNLWYELEILLNLLDAFGKHSFAVKQTVGLVDELNQVVAEAAAAQSYQIDASIANGFLAGDDVGWDVLTEPAAALNHHVAANLAELMAEHLGTDDGIIVDSYFAGKFGGIADDEMVAQHTVVGHVHVLHEQIVAAHLGRSFGGCATRNGHILADAVVVANLAQSFLALELQILWLGRQAGTGEHLVAVADTGTEINRYTILKDVVVADDGVAVNIAERADDIVLTQLGLGMHKG